MKRIVALFLVIILSFTYCSFAFANSKEPTTRAVVQVDAGLSHVSGSTYTLWGRAVGSASDTLSITVKVYKGGSYITSLSGSGSGPTVYKSKSVSLSSGTYTLEITGSTSTGNTTTRTKSITI